MFAFLPPVSHQGLLGDAWVGKSASLVPAHTGPLLSLAHFIAQVPFHHGGWDSQLFVFLQDWAKEIPDSGLKKILFLIMCKEA